jgi:hypothetical protein
MLADIRLACLRCDQNGTSSSGMYCVVPVHTSLPNSHHTTARRDQCLRHNTRFFHRSHIATFRHSSRYDWYFDNLPSDHIPEPHLSSQAALVLTFALLSIQSEPKDDYHPVSRERQTSDHTAHSCALAQPHPGLLIGSLPDYFPSSRR